MSEDTRMWRCVTCGVMLTHDAPAADHISTTASLDYGQGLCVSCNTLAMFRRVDVSKSPHVKDWRRPGPR